MRRAPRTADTVVAVSAAAIRVCGRGTPEPRPGAGAGFRGGDRILRVVPRGPPGGFRRRGRRTRPRAHRRALERRAASDARVARRLDVAVHTCGLAAWRGADGGRVGRLVPRPPTP